MVTKRIIPCLDVKDGVVVKGVNFEGLREVGDAAQMGVRYSREGADELVYLDISATREGRRTFADLVRRIALGIDIPFTVGGGIGSVDDAARLLDAGADKVTVNSAALANPSLIGEIASRYGSQCVVVAIDARRYAGNPSGYEVVVRGGRTGTGQDVVAWAREVEARGAGEILLTSMETDGTKTGFDLDITRKVVDAVQIPVIMSGGCGSLEHFYEGFVKGGGDAALAATLFHYGELTVPQVKEYLHSRGIPVRLGA